MIKLTYYLYGGREERLINAKSHYYVIFNNPRNVQQTIMFLSRMLPPGNSPLLARLIQDAQKENYSYILVDNTPECQDDLRFRSDIFGAFVVFRLSAKGRGRQMDYSRIAIGSPVSHVRGGGQVGGSPAIDRQVQNYIYPDIGQIKHDVWSRHPLCERQRKHANAPIASPVLISCVVASLL